MTLVRTLLRYNEFLELSSFFLNKYAILVRFFRHSGIKILYATIWNVKFRPHSVADLTGENILKGWYSESRFFCAASALNFGVDRGGFVVKWFMSTFGCSIADISQSSAYVSRLIFIPSSSISNFLRNFFRFLDIADLHTLSEQSRKFNLFKSTKQRKVELRGKKTKTVVFRRPEIT